MLNQLAVNGNLLTMSSKEIERLTVEMGLAKQHKNIIRDIREMKIQIEKDGSKLSHEQYQEVTDDRGYTSEIFLDKELTLTLVAGYSVKLRNAIIKRWQELESSQASQFQIPQTLPEALRLAAQLAEEKQQALEIIKQKDQMIVAVADLNIKAGQVSIAEFAKNLAISGMGQNNLYKWLKGRGFLQVNNQPYQQYVERGYFVMKPYDEKIKGEVKYKTMLTPRGTAWLSRMLHAEFELGESA